jgi:sulfonate transport system permease protein
VTEPRHAPAQAGSSAIQGARRFRWWRDSRVVPWLVPAALLLAWEASVDCGWLSTRVLPSPSQVVIACVTLARSGELLDNVAISTMRAAAGFLVGGGIGLALGLLNGLFPFSSRLLDSTLQMIRNVPHLALIPLVILWFGIDEQAKLFLVALGVFFPIYLNTYHGVRTVDAGLAEMGRVYGLGGVGLFREVVLPGALPSILVGVRYALGITWLTLIVAETVSASSGIGYMTMNAREFLQTDVVVLGIIIYAALGKLADSSTRLLERRWLAWHPAFQPGAQT